MNAILFLVRLVLDPVESHVHGLGSPEFGFVCWQIRLLSLAMRVGSVGSLPISLRTVLIRVASYLERAYFFHYKIKELSGVEAVDIFQALQ
jgi:hypothetical protein